MILELFTGTTMKFNISRKRFSAEGALEDNVKTLVIHIKPGWKEGTKISFVNEADEDYNLIPGDIIFIIKERSIFGDEVDSAERAAIKNKALNMFLQYNDPASSLFNQSDNTFLKYKSLLYSRGEGNNLIYTIPITLLSSLTGGEFKIFTLDNRIISMTLNQVISPYFQKVIQCNRLFFIIYHYFLTHFFIIL